MSTQTRQFLSREGLGEEFVEGERKASNLMLHADLLMKQGNNDEATDLFAQAAAVEERLCVELEEKGLIPKMLSHAFSAASCRAMAGDIHHAIHLCEKLLERDDLPPKFRQQVEDYAQTLRAQRDQWLATLTAGA